MIIFLKSLGHQFWGSVVEGYTKPSTRPSEWVEFEVEAYEANHKALSALHHALSSDNLCMIGKLGTTKEAWEFLEKTHGSVSSSLKDESSLSEQNSSPGSKVLVFFGMPEDSHHESGSDREEGEEEENIEEAFNQLYIENIELAKTAKTFKKKTTSLAQENENLKELEKELK